MKRFISPRMAIRHRVKEILLRSLPAWDERFRGKSGAARVSVSRVIPLFPKRLPAILIYNYEETVEAAPNADPGLREKHLELAGEIVASGNDSDDTIDNLCCAVETILDSIETLGLLVQGTRLKRTEVDMGGEGENIFASGRMIFEVSYWTKPVYINTFEELPSHAGADESCPWVTDDKHCTWKESGRCGWYENCEQTVIIGITDGVGEEPVTSIPSTVLVSWSPFIGIPYKEHYRSVEVSNADEECR